MPEKFGSQILPLHKLNFITD